MSWLVILATSAAAITLALWKGLGPERAGAAVLAVFTTFCSMTHVRPDFMPLGISMCAWANLLGLIGFSIIALKAWRLWPLWAAAMQLLAVGVQACVGLDLIAQPVAVDLMQDTSLLISSIIVASGTVAVWIGRERFSHMENWRDWIGPKYR